MHTSTLNLADLRRALDLKDPLTATRIRGALLARLYPGFNPLALPQVTVDITSRGVKITCEFSNRDLKKRIGL